MAQAEDRKVTGSAAGDGGDDNVPGFEYVQRVSTAAFRALSAHGEAMNAAWCQIRRGEFGFAEAARSWSKIVENYFTVVTEAARGPSQLARPAWQVIPYSKKDPRLNFSVPTEYVLERGAALAYTRFASLTGDGVGGDIYEDTPKAVGSRVEFRLNRKVMDGLPDNADYIGFIIRKGMGTAPPLVIVMIRVLE
jgi:hypothetical protein